jgi:hypothetical protein
MFYEGIGLLLSSGVWHLCLAGLAATDSPKP